jgi:hypothetical protein
MNGKKIAFLFLGLVLPLMVFIFLKMFGRNEFEVPLLYEDGVKETPGECNIQYPAPYVLEDSIMEVVYPYLPKSLILINFSKEIGKLKQITEPFKTEVALIDENDIDVSESQLDFLKKCILLIKSPNSIVVIDNRKRIRGYYNASNRDELDRLEAEMNIMLKKY